MLGSATLDTVIGLFLIYLLLSIFVSSAKELFEALLRGRAKFLVQGIEVLLDDAKDSALGKKFFTHPLINCLYKEVYGDGKLGNRSLPSYIPARSFALAIMDIVRPAAAGRGKPPVASGTSNALARPHVTFAQQLVVPDASTPGTSDAPGTPQVTLSQQVVVPDAPPQQLLAAVPEVAPQQPSAPQARPAAPVVPEAAPQQPLAPVLAAVGASTPTAASPTTQLRDDVANSPDLNDDVKKVLLALIDAAGDSAEQVRENIEGWFNSTMERVSGWYRRRTQFWIVVFGFVLAALLNADTIAIFRYLSQNEPARNSLIQATEKTLAKPPADGQSPAEAKKQVDELKRQYQEVNALGVPLGWKMTDLDMDFSDWLSRLLGILLTTTAIALGAPFWFDLLNTFMNVRSAMKASVKPKSEEGKP